MLPKKVGVFIQKADPKSGVLPHLVKSYKRLINLLHKHCLAKFLVEEFDQDHEDDQEPQQVHQVQSKFLAISNGKDRVQQVGGNPQFTSHGFGLNWLADLNKISLTSVYRAENLVERTSLAIEVGGYIDCDVLGDPHLFLGFEEVLFFPGHCRVFVVVPVAC